MEVKMNDSRPTNPQIITNTAVEAIIRLYVTRVAPLVQGGFISIHIKGNRGGLPGWAHTDYEGAIKSAIYWRNKGCDVYLSMGGQREPGEHKAGKPYPDANREGKNIGCLKSLFIDIDAKNYASVEAMGAAIADFHQQTNIPQAALAVKSGSGGYHLYWPFDRLLTPDQWQPLADALAAAALSIGLKFDNVCTTDRTRVLRVPATFNYKTNPPSPVTLEYDTGQDFALEELQQALAPYLPQLASDKPMPFISKMKETAKLQQTKLATDDDYDDLGAGIPERKAAVPRDIDRVATVCPHLATVLTIGGAGYSETLWRDHLRVAHWCKDREETAHRLSKGHVSYSPSETDEKLKEIAEYQQRGDYGFPRCATINRDGAKECVGCSWLRFDRSPLNAPGALAPQAGTIPDVVGLDGRYQPIPGGVYEANDLNLEQINNRYAIVISVSGAVWFENLGLDDGWVERKDDDVKRSLTNCFIQTRSFSDGGLEQKVKINMLSWIKRQTGRKNLRAVFKPNEPRFPAPGEFNMWQGWGVVPNFDYMVDDGKGGKRPHPKLKRILHHAANVICSRNTKHFEYLIKRYAWIIQHLGQAAGTAGVIKSGVKGSGKTLWMQLIVKIIGKHHAHIFTDPDHILGKHSVFEHLCYAGLDDVRVIKNSKEEHKITGLITAESKIVEPKFRTHFLVPQRTVYDITANEMNPIVAGISERRLFVPEVDISYAQNKTYFNPLIDDIETGGAEMLLAFLMSCPLQQGWTPRDVEKTSELAKMQIANLNLVHRWQFDCAESGYLHGCDVIVTVKKDPKTGETLYVKDPVTKADVIDPQTNEKVPVKEETVATVQEIYQGFSKKAPLNRHYGTDTLRDAFLKHSGCSPREYSNERIGRELRKILGPRSKCKMDSIGGRHPDNGYSIPNARTLKKKILEANGITNYHDEDDEGNNDYNPKGGTPVREEKDANSAENGNSAGELIQRETLTALNALSHNTAGERR
jgi:hypothetical protein